ncbi:hypothetical protein EC957_005197 [Mortierella hygrophila]|uniref:Uncharacterized protein n=1 Tax=Mortierella hygrophila TaxID=979708 RepID=A0A9P6F0K4_9FUNG|nr:hypothetical protein EC957_005197 [Mortierella hygrophila]
MHSDLSHPITSLAILRHLTTLRHIYLYCNNGISRVSAAVIFENCVNLETLKAFDADEGLHIDLEDVGCKLPINPDPESQPYYYRPDPITLPETEVQHFARLERFYLQIGRLTQPRFLHLLMIKLDGKDQLEWGSVDVPMAYPALMALGDVHQGRPGYLEPPCWIEEAGENRVIN